jgi:hypothetical protein
MGLWDELAKVGKKALEDAADALDAEEGHGLTPLQKLAKQGASAAARGLASEVGVKHCQARTRISLGNELACGKTATKVTRAGQAIDGRITYYCDECAPSYAKPLNVDAKVDGSA